MNGSPPHVIELGTKVATSIVTIIVCVFSLVALFVWLYKYGVWKFNDYVKKQRAPPQRKQKKEVEYEDEDEYEDE